MNSLYKNYYRNHYLRTGGFIPTKPLAQNVYPGDFFQIQNGEMIVLGNIFRNRLISPEDTYLENGVKLNAPNWNFKDGVSNAFSSDRDGHYSKDDKEFRFSKQVYQFERASSFSFQANNPESVKISNWSDIQMQLIIKLTQTQYSFREVYVATECATASEWTLAIANSERGEVEMTTKENASTFLDLFGHIDSKTVRANDIEYCKQITTRIPCFFKGKKLVVQNEKLEVFISELIGQRERLPDWASDFYDYEFDYDRSVYTPEVTRNAQASILDMLQTNQLNPNSALMYFRWEDMNLDDVEKLFIEYGY